MPRQSRSRPTAPRASTAPAVQQRAHSTAAAPPAPQHAQSYGAPPAPNHAASHAPESKPVGMMGQIAANAASVAAGSVVGHGISRMLWGGSNDAAAAPVQEPLQAQAQPYNAQYQPPPQEEASCAMYSKSLAECLERTKEYSPCLWYLEQLKACQTAAKPY